MALYKKCLRPYLLCPYISLVLGEVNKNESWTLDMVQIIDTWPQVEVVLVRAIVVALFMPLEEWRKTRDGVLLYSSITHNYGAGTVESCLSTWGKEIAHECVLDCASTYVIKVSMCVTGKNRIMKGKLPGEEMSSPGSHCQLAHTC